jgi:hypothetical protein
MMKNLTGEAVADRGSILDLYPELQSELKEVLERAETFHQKQAEAEAETAAAAATATAEAEKAKTAAAEAEKAKTAAAAATAEAAEAAEAAAATQAEIDDLKQQLLDDRKEHAQLLDDCEERLAQLMEQYVDGKEQADVDYSDSLKIRKALELKLFMAIFMRTDAEDRAANAEDRAANAEDRAAALEKVVPDEAAEEQEAAEQAAAEAAEAAAAAAAEEEAAAAAACLANPETKAMLDKLSELIKEVNVKCDQLKAGQEQAAEEATNRMQVVISPRAGGGGSVVVVVVYNSLHSYNAARP